MRLEDLSPETQRSLFAAGAVPARGKKKTRTITGKGASAAERFAFHIRAYQLPDAERELKFALSLGRHWRFDFAFPRYKIAVEIEGLVVRRIAGQLIVQGRHATIEGMIEDMRKYAAAAELGWFVLRFSQALINSGEAIASTQRVLEARGWKSQANGGGSV